MQNSRKLTPLEIYNYKMYLAFLTLGRQRVIEVINKHERNEIKD